MVSSKSSQRSGVDLRDDMDGRGKLFWIWVCLELACRSVLVVLGSGDNCDDFALRFRECRKRKVAMVFTEVETMTSQIVVMTRSSTCPTSKSMPNSLLFLMNLGTIKC